MGRRDARRGAGGAAVLRLPLKDGETRQGGLAWNVLWNFAVVWAIFIVTIAIPAIITAGQTAAVPEADAGGAIA